MNIHELRNTLICVSYAAETQHLYSAQERTRNANSQDNYANLNVYQATVRIWKAYRYSILLVTCHRSAVNRIFKNCHLKYLLPSVSISYKLFLLKYVTTITLMLNIFF